MKTKVASQWHEQVAGRCPSCGGRGLFVADGGYITCSREDCVDPTLVSDLLFAVDGPASHVVELGSDSFSIEHDLRCRVDGLFGCMVHEAILAKRPPVESGRYTAYVDSNGSLVMDGPLDQGNQ
jgi:hypothetical protein